ncbi:MAG TPA: VTT domain-containing protein [Stellaceae bacterium]|nr:VTT domain-containing protein [Stellaceae bacterium]
MRTLRLAGRVLLAALVLAGVVWVLTHRSALSPGAIKDAIAEAPMAPLIFVLAHLAASIVFVPRTLLSIAAGLLFGVAGGLFWATVGSTVGALGGFLLARYVNSGLIEPETLPRLGPLLVKAEAGGWRSVAMVRLIPMLPHPLTNYGLGLTRLSLGDYTLGTILGQIPMTVAYVEFGAAGNEVLSGGANWVPPTMIGAVVLAISIFLPRLLRRRG